LGGWTPTPGGAFGQLEYLNPPVHLIPSSFGAAIAISAVKAGDKILATNIRTGKTQAETVTAIWIRHDTDLYSLRIKAGNRTAVIHTTSSHPFWVPAADGHPGQWATAGTLQHGTGLRTSSANGTATVLGGWTPRQATVPGNNDHDFYIDTAAAPVLVHNCGPEDLNYNQIRERITTHTNVLHGFGTPAEGTKLAEGIGEDEMFQGLLNGLSRDNETGVVDEITGNHEHINPWPGAGSNGQNFVRVWMSPRGELGGMWPIEGP
jgi:Pretoxin HINT domain